MKQHCILSDASNIDACSLGILGFDFFGGIAKFLGIVPIFIEKYSFELYLVLNMSHKYIWGFKSWG